MKKLFIIDAGHGGIIDGNYVTPGKRSPEFPEGVLYEGVFNRAVAKLLIEQLEQFGIPYFFYDTNLDISLTARVNFYNKLKTLYPEYELILISIHANAASSPEASGLEVFTSPGPTKSDIYAELWYEQFKKDLGTEFKFRADVIDGDHDKEERFYVITQTAFPAFLIEHGFMTNHAECLKLMDETYRIRFANVIFKAIEQINFK